MIRDFLVSLFLAAVFSGLAYPVYKKILVRFSGRSAPAAAVTLLALVSIVLVPTLILLNLIAAFFVTMWEVYYETFRDLLTQREHAGS
jgi:predicted PurR-regulated permease PerM